MRPRDSKAVVALIVVLVLAIAFPLVARSEFVMALIVPALIWAVTCIGWTAVMRTGQFSLGQAGLMAVGAYTTCLLTTKLDVNPWLGIGLGGVVGAIIAALLGLVVLRLGGLFFVIVTLAFGEIIRVVTLNADMKLFGGVYGLLPPPLSLPWADFVHSKVPYYYTALGLVVLTGIVFWRIDQSRLGRIFRSISSNPNLAAHSGIQLMKYRVIAFTVAGLFAGMAGAIYAHYLTIITPTIYGMGEEIMVLIMSTVGGTGSAVIGPVIGAIILSPLGDYLTSLMQGAKPLVFGIVVVVEVFLLPEGLVSLPKYFGRRRAPVSVTKLAPEVEKVKDARQ